MPATAPVAQLAKAHAEGRLEDRLMHFAKPKLLIVDELGYLPFEPSAAHLWSSCRRPLRQNPSLTKRTDQCRGQFFLSPWGQFRMSVDNPFWGSCCRAGHS
jgi:hypothetical protein